MGSVAAIQGLRAAQAELERFTPYKTDPIGYVRDLLGWTPWKGVAAAGQYELFEDIATSIELQLEGKPATKWFAVKAAHGVGKTWGGAGLVNWFFDCFVPSICLTTAPSAPQVKTLLWKDIRSQRPEGFPGEVLTVELRKSPDHFAIGRVTDNRGGNSATAKFQGQHGPHLLFLLDEADGLAAWVFTAVEAMMTGGITICIMFGNPQSRTSAFHKKCGESGVQLYVFDALEHPNVVAGEELVPHAVTRGWVNDKINKWCRVAESHDEELFTFSVAWPVPIPEQDGGGEHPPGTIFEPNDEFLFRVRGIAPPGGNTRSMVSPGRYEAAKRRPHRSHQPHVASIGVDCERGGGDMGTVYVRHDGRCWRAAQPKGKGPDYFDPVKKAARKLKDAGVTELSIRVDGTGGFGGSLADLLNADMELPRWFKAFEVLEVHFGAGAHDPEQYADLVTEMYAHVDETLAGVTLVNPPNELEDDLTARLYEWKNVHGRMVKKLQDKEIFRKLKGRSPDDGDGAALALAPRFILNRAASYGDLPKKPGLQLPKRRI